MDLLNWKERDTFHVCNGNWDGHIKKIKNELYIFILGNEQPLCSLEKGKDILYVNKTN